MENSHRSRNKNLRKQSKWNTLQCSNLWLIAIDGVSRNKNGVIQWWCYTCTGKRCYRPENTWAEAQDSKDWSSLTLSLNRGLARSIPFTKLPLKFSYIAVGVPDNPAYLQILFCFLPFPQKTEQSCSRAWLQVSAQQQESWILSPQEQEAISGCYVGIWGQFQTGFFPTCVEQEPWPLTICLDLQDAEERVSFSSRLPCLSTWSALTVVYKTSLPALTKPWTHKPYFKLRHLQAWEVIWEQTHLQITFKWWPLFLACRFSIDCSRISFQKYSASSER